MNPIYVDCPTCAGTGCAACDAGSVIAPEAYADLASMADWLGWDVESFASLVALWLDCNQEPEGTP